MRYYDFWNLDKNCIEEHLHSKGNIISPDGFPNLTMREKTRIKCYIQEQLVILSSTLRIGNSS